MNGGSGAACGDPAAAMESSHGARRCRNSPEDGGGGDGGGDAAKDERRASRPLCLSTLPPCTPSSTPDPGDALSPCPRDATLDQSAPESDTTPECHSPDPDVTPKCQTPDPDASPDSDATPISRTPVPDAIPEECSTPEPSDTPKSRHPIPEPHRPATSPTPRPRPAVSGARSVKRKSSQLRQGRARRALFVATPVPPPEFPREPSGCRSQTEPPPSPDILQVSWEWESCRHASLRRRPSRRVSCRWKKPRVMPRRTTLRGARFIGGGDGSLGDNERDADAGDTVVMRQVPRQEVGVARRSSAGRHEGGDPQDTGGVRLRAKSESAASSRAKSLKRKWRHSDVLLPRLLTEALYQTRPEEGNDKGRTLLEKAKELPGYMKKISHVLFKASKDADQADCSVRQAGASTFFLDVGNLSGEFPGGVLAEGTVGEASRGPKRHSPSHRGGFLRPRTLNWNQKYQRAMLQSKARGPDICVTSPETPCSPGGPEGEGDAKGEEGKGLIGRILGQLRPRSGSTSTPRSRISVSATLLHPSSLTLTRHSLPNPLLPISHTPSSSTLHSRPPHPYSPSNPPLTPILLDARLHASSLPYPSLAPFTLTSRHSRCTSPCQGKA